MENTFYENISKIDSNIQIKMMMMVNNNGATHYAVLNAGQSVFFYPIQSPHRFHIIIDHKIKMI